MQIIHTIGTAVQENLATARSGLSGMFKKLAILGLTLGLSACDSWLPGACPAIAYAGLEISVINELNGQDVCDASVTAEDGAYRENLRAFPCRFVGAYERPGTYTVRAERTGYATREVTDVRVRMKTGDCPHVETVSLVIRLTPLAVNADGTDLPAFNDRKDDPRRIFRALMDDVDGRYGLRASGISVPDVWMNRQPLTHASRDGELQTVTGRDDDASVAEADRQLDGFVWRKRRGWPRFFGAAVAGAQRSIGVAERIG